MSHHHTSEKIILLDDKLQQKQLDDAAELTSEHHHKHDQKAHRPRHAAEHEQLIDTTIHDNTVGLSHRDIETEEITDPVGYWSDPSLRKNIE
jgi:hypothetical protein